MSAPNKTDSIEKKSSRKFWKFGNKEFSLSFVFSIISAILGFVFSYYCASKLEADRYGQIQYYLSIGNLLTIFMVFGSDNFVLKNLQFQLDKKKWISTIYLYIAICSCIVLPLYFVIAYFALGKLSQDILLIFIIYIVALLTTYVGIIGTFFIGLNKADMKILLTGIFPHLFFLIFFIVHYLTNSLDVFVNNYLYYYIGVYLLIAAIPLIKTIRSGGARLSKSDIMSMMTFAFITITYSATSPIANILIGERYDTFGVTGIFSLSSQILSIASLVSGIVGSISTPVFAKMIKLNDKSGLIKYYQMVTRIASYICLPIFIACAMESFQILNFFGKSYTIEPLILTLLSISLMIETITGPTGTILLMGGKERWHFVVSIIKFVVYFGLLASLINYTVLAAPIAAVVSMVIAVFIKMLMVIKFQGRNYFTKDVIFPIIIIAVICIPTFWGLSFISNKLIWAIANGLVGIFMISCFLFLTPYKSDKRFFTKNKETAIEPLESNVTEDVGGLDKTKHQ